MPMKVTDDDIDELLLQLKSQADWLGWDRSTDILRLRVREWLQEYVYVKRKPRIKLMEANQV